MIGLKQREMRGPIETPDRKQQNVWPKRCLKPREMRGPIEAPRGRQRCLRKAWGVSSCAICVALLKLGEDDEVFAVIDRVSSRAKCAALLKPRP